MEPFDFGSVLDATGARPVCGDRSLVFRSVSTDSRTTPPGSLFVALRGPRFDGNDHAADALRRGAVGVFVSPGRAPDLAHPQACAEHADPAAALLALAAWHRRRFRVPVIGITGSCGKTTTKDLTAACLRRLGPTVASEKSFNNDVGVPATLLRLDRETRSAVVEIGTSGPGEIARLSAIAAPTIGVITNIAEAHLEGLGTIEGVAREKGDLLEALPEDGVAILNADDRFFPALARRAGRRRVVRFALETEAEYTARDIVFHVAGASFTVQGRAATIPLLGSHVVADALAAIAAAVEAGLSLDAALAALAQIPPPERRLERKRFGEVEVLDDCYNANPASVRAAIRALAGLRLGRRRVLVLGCMRELGTRSAELHREVGRAAGEARFDLLVAVGSESGEIVAGAVDGGTPASRIVRFPATPDAAAAMGDLVRPGDLVLVKGSRAEGLERVVEAIAAAHGRATARETNGAEARG